MAYLRGAANQPVSLSMVNVATGADFAGAVSVYLEKDGAAQFLGTVGGGAATLKGNGSYQYTPSADEFDADVVKFTFKGAGAVTDGVTIATITPAEARALATATGTNAEPVSQFLTRVLQELRVVRAGESASAEDLDLALQYFNEYLDQLNAVPRAAWVKRFTAYTLTPGHQPHTIGPTGDFVATYRPVRILGANLIFATGLRLPVRIRGAEWWRKVTAYTIPSQTPSDLYYAPEQPNGSLYLWGVPSSAYNLELETDYQQGQLVLTDTLEVPQGWRAMLRLTTAERAASAFGQTFSADQKALAQEARMLVFGNNEEDVSIATDAGLRSDARDGGGFNWASRTWNP
jgi:hypothetical protein